MKGILLIFTFIVSGLFSQISMTPTSNITCSSNQSSITFSIASGQAPFTLTVTTPSCAASYSLSGLTATSTLTFACVGVYSITAKDANSILVGSTTHTVALDTVVSYGIDIYFVSGGDNNDTICLGTSFVLRAGQQPLPPNYTLSNFRWNTGDTGSVIVISPTVTSNYSFRALYTSVYSKTCTAEADTEVVVVSCATGIGKLNFSELEFEIYPNPVKDKLNLSFSMTEFQQLKLTIVNVFGEKVYSLDGLNRNQEIDFSTFSIGFYFLKIQANSRQKIFKIVKQ